MRLIQLFPILNRHFLVQVFEHFVTLFKSFEDFEVRRGALNSLHSLLELDLRALNLGNFSLCELLFLQVNDGPTLLAFFEEFLDLVCRLLGFPRSLHLAQDSNDDIVYPCNKVRMCFCRRLV